MRTPWIAVAATALASFATVVGASRLFAGDAPAAPPSQPSAEEQKNLDRLVEDLGSADFRVREAATKGLIDQGEKARATLEKAVKSENPAVRFRADQILERLNGNNKERPLEDGSAMGEPRGGPVPGMGGGGTNPNGDWQAQMERMMRMLRERMGNGANGGGFGDSMKELEEQIRKMQEEWGKNAGGPRLGGDWKEFEEQIRKMQEQFGKGFDGQNGFPGLRFGRRLARANDVQARVDDGGVVAEANENARGARITIRSKSDPSDVTIFTGKSVPAILDAHPNVATWPGIPALLKEFEGAKAKRAAQEKEAAEKEAADRAADEARRGGERGTFPGFTTSRSVKIESSGDRVRVEITENGADGKPVTKTYEGTSLEQLKADHPELRESLGGFQIHLGPGNGPLVPPNGPRKPDSKGEKGGKEEKGESELEIDDDGVDTLLRPAPTGPFGLALGEVPPALRTELSLADGAGAVVIAVRDDSDAKKIGLQKNDVILKVNDTAIGSLAQVGEVIHAVAKDAPLSIEIYRAGKTVTLKR